MLSEIAHAHLNFKTLLSSRSYIRVLQDSVCVLSFHDVQNFYIYIFSFTQLQVPGSATRNDTQLPFLPFSSPRKFFHTIVICKTVMYYSCKLQWLLVFYRKNKPLVLLKGKKMIEKWCDFFKEYILIHKHFNIVFACV